MISKTAEYALRAVLYLARVEDRRPVPVDDIAEALGAPRNYLSKTLHELVRMGMVQSFRGPTGGFALVADPETLTIAQIADAFDEHRTSGMCLLGGRICNGDDPCEAHQRWSCATEAARAPLLQTTVAYLVEHAPRVKRGDRGANVAPEAVPLLARIA